MARELSVSYLATAHKIKYLETFIRQPLCFRIYINKAQRHVQHVFIILKHKY